MLPIFSEEKFKIFFIAAEIREAYSRVSAEPIIGFGLSSFATTGFLSNCELWIKRSPYSVLQGINSNGDATGYLYLASSNYSSETYEIIFLYKGGIEKRKL